MLDTNPGSNLKGCHYELVVYNVFLSNSQVVRNYVMLLTFLTTKIWNSLDQ